VAGGLGKKKKICPPGVASSSPAEFCALIRSDRDKWAKIIKAANIRIE
jgi:hypothetical protein